MTRTTSGPASATKIGSGLHLTEPRGERQGLPRGNRQAFSRAEYDGRVRKVQEAMIAGQLDVLLVHTPENLCYLTGYETSGYFEYQVLAIPASGTPRLLIRNTERFNVDEHTWLPHAYLWSADIDYFEATARLVDSLGTPRSARVGLEYHSWFVTPHVHAALTAALSNHVIVDAGRIVEHRRLIKSPAEQAYVRAAGAIVDRMFAAAVTAAGAGRTELEVGAAVHNAQMLAGGEYPALPQFLKSGERAMLQHATPTDRVLSAGDLLQMELLGVKRRYHAAMSRTLHIGRASAAVRESASVVIDIADQLLNELKPGVAISDVTERGRARINALRGDKRGETRVALHSGDPSEFPLNLAPLPGTNRRLGYSMGIGFPPIAGEGATVDFRESSSIELQPGMVFHMLSGVSPELTFTDTVLITDDGWERFAQSPRELIEA